ncbi:MAG TPA: hypothetical protein VE869_14975 [Gemmatimonas sp.]|nr:hypothetical protein [Gemmatimonas sp.]
MSEDQKKDSTANSGDKTSTGLVAAALVASLAITWIVAGYRGVEVFPWPRTVAASPYATELCASPPDYGQSFDPRNRDVIALTREAARSFHTTYVWSIRDGRLHPVVSLQESDPGSGRSYLLNWSRDGRALLITGNGRLPFRWRWEPLALAYIIESGTLQKLPSCNWPQ